MNHLPKLPEVIELIRPNDLLNLWIETVNLRLERDPSTTQLPEDGPVFLVIDDPDHTALLRVIFPPQHIAEFAAFESDPASSKIVVDTSGVNGSATAINNKRQQTQQTESIDKNDKPLGKLDPEILPLPGTNEFKARIASSSRLVFRVPAGLRIPYTVEGLLDWSGLKPVLHPIAALGENASATERASAPAISAPNTDQTALELPYRLLISPDSAANWTHRSLPFGSQGRYELWHTRLVAAKEEGFSEIDLEHPAQVRALWSPDYRPNKNSETPNRHGTTTLGLDKQGRSALSDDDRHQIVILTSAFHGFETNSALFIQNGAARRFRKFGFVPYKPKPFQASQLMLSPLGGWLTSRGDWLPPRRTQVLNTEGILDVASTKGLRELFLPFVRANGNQARLRNLIERPYLGFIPNSELSSGEQLDLSEWVHVATQGRDHFVQVVYEGELLPYYNKAAMVKITERKFVQCPDLKVIACLVQHITVVVREPEKIVARNDSHLTKVRLTTLVTPNLAEPIPIIPTVDRSFWIEIGADTTRQKFQFHAVGTDRSGREVDFTIPMVFASISDTENKIKKEQIVDTYNASPDRAADFMGAKIAFTPLEGSENPLLLTRTVLLEADPKSRPPRLLSAEVTIPALTELLGQNKSIKIAYDDTGENSYVKKGYDPANTIGVFAKIIDTLPLGFRSDQAGGFATPNQTLTALSLKQGPIAGEIATAMLDSFVPSIFFPPTAPTGVTGLPLLFGTFGFDKLIKGGSLSSQAPKITTERGNDSIVTHLLWKPQIMNGKPGEEVKVGVAAFEYVGTDTPPILEIQCETITPLSAGLPQSLFKGTLNDFDITLLDSVTIHFTEFSFTSRNGEKPAIKVVLNEAKPLEFLGELKFVEELRNAIPPGLFGEGASVTVGATDIRAGFSIGLPPLEIGVFALKDISLGAALTLPFLDGKPILDFNVSERANPFQLRVSFFAGGGFFHLQMDTKGMRQLEASLEFGAAFGLSIAVATGEVHAMAGIYFAITRDDNDNNKCTLTGFMRLGGRLSVIGIIRLSVEFNLSFTYQEATDKVYGRATVTVMVEVLFISVSVELTVERAFGGAGDPVFFQTFPKSEIWHEYASAFA